jgi:hypothetical protein
LPPQTNGVAGRLACCPDVVVINRDAAGGPDGSSLKLTDLLHCAGCVRSNSSSWHLSWRESWHGVGVQLTVILGNIGVQPGDSPPRGRLKNLSGVGGDEVRRCRPTPREGTRYQRMAMKTSSMASDTASGMVAEPVTPPCLVLMVR